MHEVTEHQLDAAPANLLIKCKLASPMQKILKHISNINRPPVGMDHVDEQINEYEFIETLRKRNGDCNFQSTPTKRPPRTATLSAAAGTNCNGECIK